MRTCMDCDRLTGDDDPNSVCPECLEQREAWIDAQQQDVEQTRLSDVLSTVVLNLHRAGLSREAIVTVVHEALGGR